MDKNKLKDQANKFFEKENYLKAVDVYKQIYEFDPNNERGLLIRIATCYEKMANKKEAILYYIKAAKDFAQNGFFLKAIATLKNVLEIESNHKETQELIADLYAKNGKLYQTVAKSSIIQVETLKSEKEDNIQQPKEENKKKPPKIELKLEDHHKDIELISDDDIISTEDSFTENDIFGMQIAEPIEVIDASQLLVPLPEIPLFSELDREIFIELMNKMKLRKFKQGNLLIKEGDDATAFYIISEGEVRVKKELEDGNEIELAILKNGDFFGEMAILGNAKRTASIEAISDVEVFELSTLLLDNLVAKYESVRQTLYKFYKNRLLYNIVNTSPVFGKLSKEKRISLLKLFKAKQLPPNYPILKQNGEITGLYIIVDGNVKIYRFLEDNKRQDITVVSRGAVLGEISFVKNKTPIAYCTTVNDSWVLRLAPEDFKELKTAYPEVLEYLEKLVSDRLYELDLITNLKLGIY